METMDGVTTFILAGGAGRRLFPLTRDRAKPAVAFGTKWRLIDFTLANCLHSGMRSVAVLTQYKGDTVAQHGARVWRGAAGMTVRIVSPGRDGRCRRYRGTADAVFQNLPALERSEAADALVLAGDHVYAMDYRPLVEAHREAGSDVTIATIPVPRSACSQFGILRRDMLGRVREFIEKPDSRDPRLDHGPALHASMGIYVFRRDALYRLLADGPGKGRWFDFGADVIPNAIESCRVFSHEFRRAPMGVRAYWRDVGTIDSYFAAHMELLDGGFSIDPDDPHWPASPDSLTGDSPCDYLDAVRTGPSCTLDGSVSHAVLGRNVVIESGAHVRDAVILDGARIGAGCRIRRAIIGERSFVEPGTLLGFGEDPEGTFRSAGGVAVLVRGEDGNRQAGPCEAQSTDRNRLPLVING